MPDTQATKASGWTPISDFASEWYPYGNQNTAMKIVADLATNEHAVEVLDMARELLDWREASRARKATSE